MRLETKILPLCVEFTWGKGKCNNLLFCQTYHIDELNESQSEGNLHLLCHILHRSDELIVASKEVTHQPLLFLRAQTYNTIKKTKHQNIVQCSGGHQIIYICKCTPFSIATPGSWVVQLKR